MGAAGKNIIKLVLLSISIVIVGYNRVWAQCKTSPEIWNNILAIENDELSPPGKKLKQALTLKKEFEVCKLQEDSVYARLLHRIAALQYVSNGYIATTEAVDFTIKAISINKSGNKSASPSYAINSYFNLATFYKSQNLNNKALSLYDTVITLGKKENYSYKNIVQSRTFKADIYFKKGDYQKCIDECTYGLAEAKITDQRAPILELFNRRSQSYAYLGLQYKAFADADSAEVHANSLHEDFELATAFKTKAMLYSEQGDYGKAISLFRKVIAMRLQTKEMEQISDDYTDLGNFYLQKLKDYSEATRCYLQTIEFASKTHNAERLCKGYINLGEATVRTGRNINYAVSQEYYCKALQVYGITDTSFLYNPELKRLSVINNTDLLFILLNNKTELLLKIYKLNNNPVYLNACFETAMVMDSAVAQARKQQVGEQSKLYWRNKTRSFFTNVLEACYLANNMEKAFYFMERSRAVLLNDKLNELNASIHLPIDEEAKEQTYLLRLVADKKQLNALNPSSDEYSRQQIKLLQTQSDFEKYTRGLEREYPLYYQYKYADDIPSLQELQGWLARNNRVFVHYFVQDSVMYMLPTESGKVRMIKISGKGFDIAEVSEFLDRCANKQELNNNHSSFVTLSNALYKAFFKPLQLTAKNVVLCQDNFLLPFEALYEDEEGKKPLIYDYTFSYVYSASYLLKKIINQPSSGNYIGFAPVSFQSYLSVPDLKNAAQSLKNSAASYSNPILFSNKEATKNNFMRYMSSYSVVNVFSHALADTINMEPVLYMQDSVINLSELQLLNKPATQLVMLSACQTNVGRNATGEGIYSLARGFASTGVPAVSATLWKADEEAIYIISKKFNEGIAAGMNKDDALRQAKLFFIQQGDKEKLLPYFWANMVLIGNGDPVRLLAQHSWINWWIIITSGLVSMSLFLLLKKYAFRGNSSHQNI